MTIYREDPTTVSPLTDLARSCYARDFEHGLVDRMERPSSLV